MKVAATVLVIALSLFLSSCSKTGYHTHEIQVPPEASVEDSRKSLHQLWTQIFHVIDLTEIRSISTDSKSWIRIEWKNDDKHHHGGDHPGLPDGFWWPGKDSVCPATWRRFVRSAKTR